MSRFKKGQIVRCTHFPFNYDVLVTADPKDDYKFSGIVVKSDKRHPMGYTSDTFAASCFILLHDVPDPEEELKRALDQLAKDLQDEKDNFTDAAEYYNWSTYDDEDSTDESR